MYLVDTNVLSELPRRHPDPGVVSWLAGLDRLAVSAVTIDELSYGVERAPAERSDRLRAWFDELLATDPLVIPIDRDVARAAGVLRAQRERRGHSASQADMLIAATALMTGRVLATRNTKDFAGCAVALLNPFSET